MVIPLVAGAALQVASPYIANALPGGKSAASTARDAEIAAVNAHTAHLIALGPGEARETAAARASAGFALMLALAFGALAVGLVALSWWLRRRSG